jgi:hypothetical protein
VTLDTSGKHLQLMVRGPIGFKGASDAVELDPKSDSTVRALAELLNQHPSYVVLVGARPKSNTPAEEQRALNQAFAIVFALRHLTHRDEVAEVVGFQVVKQTPGAAARGIGFGLLE